MRDNRKLLVAGLVAAFVIAAVIGFVYAHHKPKTARVTARTTAPVNTAESVDQAAAPKLKFASAKIYDSLLAKDQKIKPSVPEYKMKSDLSNISNLGIFKKRLDRKQREMIAKNSFVVSPTGYIQMFQVYENNEYERPLKIPSFITTDSMLHTYHLFYDYSLREVESSKLFDAAVKLTEAMLTASEQDLNDAKDESLKDSARRNVAFFAVARNLLNGTPPPSSVAEMAQTDLKKIDAHEGRDFSTIMGLKIDFSQFVPRGHYTRSEKLKKYFKAMMWYGLTPFPTPSGNIGSTPTRQALMVVRNLRSVSIKRTPAMKLWETIYEPTAFYVGTADDFTVYQYANLMDKTYGKNPAIEAFADQSKLKDFISAVKNSPGPRIENFVATSKSDHTPNPDMPTGRQFRFMGQRFIPDSRIMQELTDPKANGRNFPKGLDVFAAMGSDRALDILEKTYNVNAATGYQKQMIKMRDEMAHTSKETWQSNLYYGWLWSLQSLNKPVGKGYPSFMRSNAWLDKSLFTSLGSWTELRHDTILYAKQSVSECGGGEEPIPTPKGYIEPNLELWTKLKWLNQYTKDGLDSRGILTPELKDKFSALGDWIDFARNITIKELTGKKVTEEEYQHIEYYGADLERLLLDFAGGDIISDTDKDMAVVADVHTSFDAALEEGTGRAAEIFVVVPIEGKLYLTRGAVYTQYEFEHPAADRLTDEQWQKMLKENREPGFAEWIDSFFIQKKKAPAPEFENYFGGC